MRKLPIALALLALGCGGGTPEPAESTPGGPEASTPAPVEASTSTPEGPVEDVSGIAYDPVPHEGFYPFEFLSNEWMAERGIAIDADAVRRVGFRTAKLIIDDGEKQASAADLSTLESRYCSDEQVRMWNEDRCSALASRTCEGDTCTYDHFGNCSGLILGNGLLLTAAHCVDGMVDHPERRKTSAVLMPGPFGTPERLPVGEISVGKADFDHHWVALGEKDPVDVATVAIEDHGAPPFEVARDLPAEGAPVFIVGYPRVERRSAADRKRSGYELNFGTPAASFGTLADANRKNLPLCNVDGWQEHWALREPCLEGEVEVEGTATWKGVITRSVALADFDSCNGYSGAPVLDAQGRLIGVNVTLISKVDPQDRFDPQTRQVFVPARRALARLGVEVP